MSGNPIYNAIRETIHAYLPDSQVLLFGSRARGTEDKYSDYDLMVITPNPLTQKERLNWSSKIDRAIVHTIHIPIDLLIFSKDEIIAKRDLPVHIVRTVMREGIAL
jgi:predicted nucleotidyltransferase